MIFDFFNRNKDKEKSNVLPFPTPYIGPEKPVTEPHKTYYTFGLTDDNRIDFTMGYTTLTMNAAGAQQLIDHLEYFKNQLSKE